MLIGGIAMATSAPALADGLPDASPFLFSKSGGVETFHPQLGTIGG